MAGGGKAENTGTEAAMGYALLAVVACGLLYLAWTYMQVDIRNMIRWMRYGEMLVLSPFIGNDYMVDFNNTQAPWRVGFEDTTKWQAEQLTFKHLSYFSALTMQPLRPLFALIAGLGAVWCLFYGPKTRYRTRLDLERLIRRQSKIFPLISPIVNFNPSKVPPRPPGAPVPAELPDFAEALGPEEWLAYNQIPAPDGNIDTKAAAKAFEQQLGARWRGPDHLAPYKQVLLAAFSLKAARKRKDADTLLGKLALCWSQKNGLKIHKDILKESRRILRDKKLAAKVLTECNRHAFETTALIRALSFAREEGGVLAPSQFVWLRAHDRLLWYPLNNLGRQSFHMEALGAMSHFKAERMTQRPIPVPKVENAAKTIADYMKSGKARPIPQLDYGEDRQKAIKKPA